MAATQIIYLNNNNYRYGFHVQKLPKIYDSVKRILYSTPLRAMQIYISNSRSKNLPDVDVKDILSTRELLEEFGAYMCVHGCLLYNLAGSVKHKKDPKYNEKLDSTCRLLIRELDIGVGLGVGIVVHIGSCIDKKTGIKTIAESMEYVLSKKSPASMVLSKSLNITENEFIKRRKIILENAAGEGNKIGSNLEEIAAIIKLVDKKYHSQVKVCIDTAHALVAGIYDWCKPKEVRRFYKDFDRLIGLEFLEVFHLNDSRVPLGSKKDRHENLGEGYVFSEGGVLGLFEFFKMVYEYNIPVIGEPPGKSKDGGPGLGGIYDFELVCNLSKDTKYAIIS